MILGDIGNTVAIEALETLVGSTGKDVVSLTAAASLRGVTVAVAAVETLIGGTGTDVFIFNQPSGTVFVSGVETVYFGNQSIDLDGADQLVAFPIAAVPPSTPALSLASDTGVLGDSRTSMTLPTLTGTAAANSVVNLYGNGTALGSGTTNGSGQWAITANTVLADGVWTLTAKTVTSGMESAASAALLVTIDATAPSAPSLSLTPASDSGVSSTDGITRVTTPTATGTAEAGSVVSLYDGTSLLGSTTADSAGAWSFATSALSVGAHTLTARAVDAAGNTGTASSGLVVTVDTNATAPTGLALVPASDTGTAGDRLTSITTPAISGTAEANAVVSLYDGSALVGSATANPSGVWQATLGALSEGAHTLTAQAVDQAGNTSGLSTALTITIDTTPPTAPSAPTLTAGSDSGSSSSDRLTNVTAPTFTGTAEASSVIDLLTGGSVVGTATADLSGLWTITASAQGEGGHTFTTRSRDAAGNTRDGSGSLLVTIDTTAPDAPGGVKLTAATDSGRSTTDGVTSNTSPVVTGTAGLGSTVALYDGASLLGSATVNAQGNWEFATSGLSVGDHTLTARAVDAAGNTGAASSDLVVTVDTNAAPPTGLALTGASDTGVPGDRITKDTAPAVAGTAEGSSVVTLYEGSTVLGQATAAAGGQWTIIPSGLSGGNHTLVARSVDLAGNTSVDSAALVITVDVVAPDAPVGVALASGSDSGTPGDDGTRIETPTITGTAEVGSTVSLYDGATLLGTALADSGTGAWSIVTSSLGAGAHTLTAKATDTAGNTGAASATLIVTIDTQSDQPTGLALTTASDSGSSSTDRLTNVITPTVTGTAEAGATVTLYSDGSAVGTAVANNSGLWSVTSSALSPGLQTLTARAVDVAGNTSAASAGLAITIDTSAPDIGVLTGNGDLVAPTISGTAEAGSVISLYDSSAATTLLGIATAADGSGAWSITTPEFAGGTYTLTARAVDAAGNTSTDSELQVTLTGRVGIPGGLALTSLSDTGASNSDRITSNVSPVVTGTAQAGGTVTLSTELNVVIGTAVADGSTGQWTISPGTTLPEGTHTLRASGQHNGTALGISSGLTITIDVTAPDMPSSLGLQTRSDSGLSGTDRITNAANPIVTGSAEAGSIVTLYDTDGSTVVGLATSDVGGQWAVTSTLVAGTHDLTAKVVDVAGNTSPASATLTVTIDRTGDTPAILTLVSDSSTTGDGITNVLAPTLAGTAEAGGTVSLYKGGNLLGTGTADNAGAWTITTSALGNGSHDLTARLVDLAGNTSPMSGSFAVTIDAMAPDAPGALTLSADSAATGDGITNIAAQTISGTAEADSRVVLYDGTTVLGTATATGGTWAISAGTLAAGPHTLTAKAVDAAGNTGAASAGLVVTIDTATPDPSGLALTAASDTGLSPSDRRTKATTLSLTGSAEANSTVTLYDNGSGAPLGTAVADGTGAWSFTASGFTEGEHTLTATAADLAGNTSTGAGTLTVTIDLTVTDPAAPVLAATSDTGTIGDNRTRLLSPTITGTVEAGAQVSLYDGGGFVGMTTANGAGLWEITAPLAAGDHTLTTRLVDLAGNSSNASANLVISIDASAPDAPVGLALDPASDSSTVGDRLTKVVTPTLTGTAEAASTVLLYAGSTSVGTATADVTTGAWTVTTGSLADGIHTLTARSVDTAGNTSVASGTLLVTIDTTTPVPTGVGLTAATDSGRLSTDAITRVKAPTVAGTAEAGAIVTLYEGGTLLGSGTASNAGLWFVATPTLASGPHTLDAVVVDGAGNTTTASNILTVTIDLSTAAPTGLTLASDSGLDLTDRLTNVVTPLVTGTAEASAAVQLYEGTRLLGSTTADSSGSWTLTSNTLINGLHTLSAVTVDLAGNTSAASAGLVVTIDTVNDAPTGLALSAASDTGISQTDGLTRLATPAVVGTAEALSVVTLYEGGSVMGMATSNAQGAFTVASSALSAGSHTLTVRSVDRAGNTSTASSGLVVSVDLSTVQPTIAMAQGSDTGASNSDRITAATQPVIYGTAEAGSTVTVYAGNLAVGTAEASTLGAWSIQTNTLAAGNHSMTAIAVDAAGNTSAASTTLMVTIDTLAITPSLGLSTATNSGLTSDTVTNDSTPDLTGSMEPGGVISLYEGATLRGSATADQSGVWTVTSSQLSNGNHTLTARGIDLAGNTSDVSSALVVTIDTIAPSAATGMALAAGSDVGLSSSDRITRITTPSFTGSAEANSTITLYDGNTVIGTALANGAGNWTVTSASTLTSGQHSFRVTVADLAGNVSAASSPLSVTIDTTAPTLSALSLTAATDTGTSSTDGITRNPAPTVTGTVKANSAVTVYDGGTALGTVTANGLGIWSLGLPTLAAATHTLSAVAMDRAGNTSSPSANFLVTIDTSAATPTGLALSVDSGISGTDRLINTGTPTLVGSVGTAEANGIVQLYDGASLVGIGTAGGDGQFTVASSGLSAGTHSLTAKLVDLAGNTSGASTALAVTIDLTAPGAPDTLALSSASDNGALPNDRITSVTIPTVTGTAEAGSTVVLYDGTTALGTATATGGAWTITAGSALAGSDTGTAHSLFAVAIDAAGNTGAASSTLMVTIDTGAVAPSGLALAAASDSGILGDLRTSSQTPTINGLAEAGSIVTLFEKDPNDVHNPIKNLGGATADGAGFWAVTSTQTLVGGSGTAHTLFATIVDLAGNTSTASTPELIVTVDTVPDSVTVALDSSSDDGVQGDRITGKTTPILTGIAGDNRPVVVSLDGTPQATVTANGSGIWLYTAGPLGGGAHNVSISSDDGSGNIGTDGVTITIDVAGDTPSTPTLAAGSDSGRNTTDNRTNIVTPTILGSAEAGGTVTLYDNGGVIGTVTASGLGTWVFTTPSLGSGDHTLTASVVDVTGNTSGQSSGLVVTIDTVAANPTGLALAASTNSGSLLDSITRFTAPVVTGTAEANNAVMLYDGTTLVGISTADGTGAWSIQSGGLAEGTRTLTARTIDVAGNTSNASGALLVTIDSTAPGSPTLALAAASDSGILSNDRLTNITSPTVTGSADAGSTVTLYDGTTSLGTVTAGGGGGWTITTSASLSAGLHSLTALAVDVAGNTGAASAALTVTIDTSATTPSALDLVTASDSGVSSTDGITNVTAPTIQGLAEANSVVTLRNGATPLGTATADGSGSWSFTASGWTDGTYTLTATGVDLAGNTSLASSALIVTIDTAIGAPSELAFAIGSDIGRSASDGITKVTTPTVTGNAEANSVVSLYDGSNLVGQATASGAGAWTITTSVLGEAAHTLTARAADAAGNTSAASTALTLTIDTTMATPSLFMAVASDSGFDDSDLVTNNATPTFHGTAEALSSVSLYDGATLKGTTTADAQGNWTITSATLSQGARQISIQAVDVAGNTAGTNQISMVTVDGSGNTTIAASGLTVTIDIIAPTQPGPLTLDPDSDSGIAGNGITNISSPSVGGTAEANARVRLYDGATLVGESDADENGVWSGVAAGLALGLHTLTAVAVDRAGNSSTASGGLTLTIMAAPTAPTVTLAALSDSGTQGDNRTNIRTPTLTGTTLASGLVTLYAGANLLGTTTANGSGAWTFTTGTLSGTSQTLTAMVRNADGVDSPASAPFILTLDTLAPTLVDQSPSQNAVGVAPASSLTLTFSEAVARGTGTILVKQAGTGNTVASVAVTDASQVQINGGMVTINPGVSLGYNTGYYLDVPSGAFTDLAGNGHAGIGVVGGVPAFAFTTMAEPAPPQPPSTPVVSTIVDGVAIQQQQTVNSDGTVSRTITIPVVTGSRVESVGNNSVADIPLITTTTGQALLTAQVPVGLGLQVSGQTAPKAAGNSLSDLITEIQARTSEGSADQANLTGGGSSFLSALPTSTPLLVQTIVPTMGPGSTANQRLVISATPTTAANPTMTALVIDTRNLPTGSEIELEDVDFAAVIGAVHVTGGNGSQHVFGDSANQYMVLGADDDTLHGGGGDDFVGSRGGNDLLYGDAGNDTVQGGEENDTLHGGQDHDLVFGNTGQDVLFGNTGQDTLYGGRGNDELHGGRDNDHLFGDNDADHLSGDQGDDALFGNTGQDTLLGNTGQDTLYGGRDDDVLHGGRDDDWLFGDAGNDTLWGDLGADTLSGGLGADLFAFADGSGRDVITDFHASDGDRIGLAAGRTYSVRSDTSGNAVIVFTQDDEVTLKGIGTSQVNAAWFITV
nr:Ig-like domain-containing protein [Azospirillum picis]